MKPGAVFQHVLEALTTVPRMTHHGTEAAMVQVRYNKHT